eukprot:8972816-Pyramimonas_sp.AAC.1
MGRFGSEIVESGIPRTEPRGLGMSWGEWWPGKGQVAGMGRFWATNFWARNRNVGGPKNTAQRPGDV